MKLKPLPIQAGLAQYQQQADALYAAYTAGDITAMGQMKDGHPQWWRLAVAEFRQLNATPSDAQVVVAWYYAFNSWNELATWVAAVAQPGSLTARFETAVDAIVAGDIKVLKTLLQEDPALISARSMRSHHSMLLHYTGTNGVEGYRQRYPPNAVEVLQLLLAAGAEVNATADMYGGGSTTFGLLATSIHPAKAGIMSTMLEILLKAGAFIDQPDAAGNDSPAINGCLHNGRPEAADFLMRHGALLDLEGAAGTGRLDIVQTYFNEDGSLKDTATTHKMNYGYMWACEFGHVAVIDFLIGKGLDVNVNVDGMYGLHWALIGGHLDVVKLLIARGASLELRNMYGGDAIGCCTWAIANSSEVYRWPEKEVDYIAIMEELLKTGIPVERGMLAWLEKESDIPSPAKEQLDILFRKYGATT
ncbi:MAG: ankyrin repeat domain-containing protein [Niastella sp.]|nr:ankyrin repeat domain-containing protein [Niastella sp.]